MSDQWDGDVVMSTPGGPIVTLSLGEFIARKDAEIEQLRAEVKRLREVIRTIRARCVEMDDSDAVSETLDISSAALEDEP